MRSRASFGEAEANRQAAQGRLVRNESWPIVGPRAPEEEGRPGRAPPRRPAQAAPVTISTIREIPTNPIVGPPAKHGSPPVTKQWHGRAVQSEIEPPNGDDSFACTVLRGARRCTGKSSARKQAGRNQPER